MMNSTQLLSLFQPNRKTELLDYIEEKLKANTEEIKELINSMLSFSSVSFEPIRLFSELCLSQIKTVNSLVWSYYNRDQVKNLSQVIVQTKNIDLIKHLLEKNIFNITQFLVASVELEDKNMFLNLLPFVSDNQTATDTFVILFSIKSNSLSQEVEKILKDNHFEINLEENDIKIIFKRILYDNSNYKNIKLLSPKLFNQMEDSTKLIHDFLKFAIAHYFFLQDFKEQIPVIDFFLEAVSEKDRLNFCEQCLHEIDEKEMFNQYLKHFTSKNILDVSTVQILKNQINTNIATECLDDLLSQLEKCQLENKINPIPMNKIKIKI